MTKLLLKLSGVAFILTLLIATGCEDDPVVDPLGPEITYQNADGFIFSDTSLAADITSFNVRIQANIGDNPLRTLTFLVNGTAVSGADINNYIKSFTSNGSSITPNNPLLIADANTNGGIWEAEIVPFGQMEDEMVSYAFQVEDEVGESAIASIDVTLVNQGTPIDEEINGVLFNQAGPTGTGGLDLDTGTGTGSADADSEIRDLGLDCTIPAPGFNWRRQIGTINGADMRAVDASQIENFTFDNVRNKEEIEAAYDAGDTLANGESVNCATSATTPVTDVSNEVATGDMFVILSNGTYYLIRIDAVNETGADNNDNYELSIKY